MRRDLGPEEWAGLDDHTARRLSGMLRTRAELTEGRRRAPQFIQPGRHAAVARLDREIDRLVGEIRAGTPSIRRRPRR